MQVLIDLSSLVLSEALDAMLKADGDDIESRVYREHQCYGNFWPDVIVFDCYRCSEQLFVRWPKSRFLLIDTFNDQKKAAYFLVANHIDGIISPRTDFPLFKKALHSVAAGQLWVEQKNIRYILRNGDSLNHRKSVGHLREKDREIVDYIVDGLRNREIAERLFLSEQTVKAHVSRIYRQMGVSCRSQLVSLVLQNQ